MNTEMPKNHVYYLASPYSSPDPYIREQRYLEIIKVATDLICMGYTLLEPIAMSHHHAQRFGLPSGYDFWRQRDRRFIEMCDAVLVCMMKGWDKSVGVTDEIEYAKSIGKPVYYLKHFPLNPKRMECVRDANITR